MSLKQKQEERLKLLEEFKRKKEMLKNNLERRGAKATRPTALKSNTTAIAFKSTPVGKSSAKNAEKLCSNPLATEIKQERELIVKTELNPERSLANSCHNQYVDLHNDDITSENIQTFSECLVSPTVQSTAAAASSKATTEKENFFDVTYESERGVDGCETELIRAQQVYDMRNNLEDIQSPEDSERSNQSISFPFLKTTIQSAVNASRIDLNLARDIFYQLKKVDFPTKAMYNDGMEIKVLDRPWRFNIQFWLEWARIEEANGAVVECEEVFAEAADALSGVEVC